jgi:hypothetical protein
MSEQILVPISLEERLTVIAGRRPSSSAPTAPASRCATGSGRLVIRAGHRLAEGEVGREPRPDAASSASPPPRARAPS